MMVKTRLQVYLQINKQSYQLSGTDLLLNLSTFLRDKLQLTATKAACNEGDCGACTVLIGRPDKTSDTYTMHYQLMNSCILPVFTLDATHIITLEGLNKEHLSVIQQAMVDHGAAQCGYCTPGMVISLVNLFQQKTEKTALLIKEKLKGNLCRCTGYQPIINAALSVSEQQHKSFTKDYDLHTIAENLWHKQQEAVTYNTSGDYFSLWIPTKLNDALRIKKQYNNIQICAGCSDLAPIWNKKWNKKSREKKDYLSLYKIASLAKIKETKKTLHIGAQVSLQAIQNYLAEDKLSGFESFEQLLHRFASPQIKNRATLAGNIANASPVGDTIPFLMVIKAKIECQQIEQSRLLKITKFYKGYKQLALKNNEIITAIILPKLKKCQQCFLYKVSQRYDIDISSVSAAFFIQYSKKNKIKKIRIAFGGIAATVIRLYNAEKIMQDQELTEELVTQVAVVVLAQIKPLADIRGSEKFRRKVVENLFHKFYFDSLART